ncbi:MAG: esterase-like activity of phytase family protein [Sphingomonas bacterium]
MRILYSVLLLLFLTPTWMGSSQLPLLGDDPVFEAQPVSLDAGRPALRRVGQLTWLGGVQLTGHTPAFGGFSSMRVAGDHFTLLSDGGNIVRFRMDSRWRLSERGFAELPAGPGAGWGKEDRDSESMTIDPGTGQIWVGFERANAIWRYTPGLAQGEAHAAPPAMADWPPNGGAESMVRLADGSFVVISEIGPGAHGKGRAAIRFAGDPTGHPRAGFAFSFLPPAGFDPSDITALPDGRLLVLVRKFRLPLTFAAKLMEVDPASIRPGAMVRGREIATLAEPLIHGNFEGLAVTREGSATIIWICSDNDQLFLQRSLLLKFRLEPDPVSAHPLKRDRPASRGGEAGR